MKTIFSYIIQKRFSRVNEDVATDALAYVLETSESARRGIMKLLRGIVPSLPSLLFRTQEMEGTIRPDLWGFSETEPRLFLENKFWAGLTDNQPVAYLNQLARYTQPAALLVIAPSAREHTLWRELTRRLSDAGMAFSEKDASVGIARCATTEAGPVLALTSWNNVLAAMEHEAAADDPAVRSDLVQLRALCDAADIDAFIPVSKEDISDQRVPAFVMQLVSLVQEAVDYAVGENILSVAGLRPQASWDRIGRYASLSIDARTGIWVGVHFGLWKLHGSTTLWILFYKGKFGDGENVRRLIDPWAARNNVLTAEDDQVFAVALDIPAGEEKSTVIRSLADQIKEVAAVLSELPPRIDSAEELE